MKTPPQYPVLNEESSFQNEGKSETIMTLMRISQCPSEDYMCCHLHGSHRPVQFERRTLL